MDTLFFVVEIGFHKKQTWLCHRNHCGLRSASKNHCVWPHCAIHIWRYSSIVQRRNHIHPKNMDHVLWMNKEHGSAKGKALDFLFSFTFYTVSQKFWNWGCSLPSSLQKLKSLESKVKSHHREIYEYMILISCVKYSCKSHHPQCLNSNLWS